MTELLMLCILFAGTLREYCEMKHKSSRQARRNQPASQAEGDFEDYSGAELFLQKDTVDYYEQRWKDRIKDRRTDILIAISLYLILASVALVVF